jgi:spermidine/putrescine transport system permease protein
MSLEKREKVRAFVFVIPALLWTLAFFIVPFVVMLVLSLAHIEGREIVQDYDLENYFRIFTQPSLLKGIFVSLEITLSVTVVSVLLAWPLAWIIAMQVPKKWQRLAIMLIVLPFWTSYVVRSYAWALVLGQNGIIMQGLIGVGILDEPIQIMATRSAQSTQILFNYHQIMPVQPMTWVQVAGILCALLSFL